MPHDGTTTGGGPGPMRREPTAARRPSEELRSHPKRMEGLTRVMARRQEELWGMQREAIIALQEAISRLGTVDRCSRPGVAGELLTELEAALDEVRSIEHDMLPRPEHLFAIADRLRRLNGVLPVSAGATADGGTADAGDGR